MIRSFAGPETERIWRGERFWLGLQADYDLEEAERRLGSRLEEVEHIAA